MGCCSCLSHSAESAFFNTSPLNHSLSDSLSSSLCTAKTLLLHCFLLNRLPLFFKPSGPPHTSISLQPRRMEDRTIAREHPSSIRSDPPSYSQTPTPTSLLPCRSYYRYTSPCSGMWSTYGALSAASVVQVQRGDAALSWTEQRGEDNSCHPSHHFGRVMTGKWELCVCWTEQLIC